MSNTSRARRGPAVACAISAAFLAFGGPGYQGLAAAEPGKPPQAPVASPPPRPGEPETIFLDLDRAPEPITVPPDKAVVIRVRLRAGGRTYDSTDSHRGGRGFGKPLWNLLSLGPTCEVRQKALITVFSAVTVKKTRDALEAFHATEASHPCPASYEAMMARQVAVLSPEVELFPAKQRNYDPAPIVIQEFDDQRNVAQTWEFPVVRLRAPSKNGTEETWIVRSIVEDMAALAHREVRATAIRAAGLGYIVELEGLQPQSVSIGLDAFIWDPVAFSRAATTLGGPPPSVAPPPIGMSPLEVLRTPTDENLHAVETGLRAHLARFPADPRAHDASAFLLGVLGLRHSEGATTDLRPLLNRMTAHLALATALSKGPRSVEGNLARIMLDLLTRREQAAATSLTALRATPSTPGLVVWERALRMRATKDWRVLTNRDAASLIERLEYFRAVVRTRGKDFAVSQMGPATSEAIPDWSRLLACDQTCVSVELGNAIGEEALKWELGSATNIGRLLGAETPSAWWWRETPLNRRHPIPDELWRGLSERAIAAAFFARNQHLAARADYEGLRRFPAWLVATYPHSRALGLLAPLLATAEGSRPVVLDPAACKIGVDAANGSPWKTTSFEWRGFAQVCQNFPPAQEWFDPWVPRGTLYDYKIRLWTAGLPARAAAADWAALARLPSYEFDVIGWRVGRLEQRDPDKRDFEPFRPEFGYNVQPLRDWRRVATTLGRPKDALEPARLACKIEAEDCFPLIDILRANDLPDEAFHVAKAALEASGGTVAASQNGYWLVDEYVRRGQTAAARAVARQGAETGSNWGLYTLSRLMEREGRFEEALRLKREIDSRYDDSTEQEFLIRRLARLTPRKKGEIQERLLSIEDERKDGGMISEYWLNSRGIVFRRDAEAMGLRQGDQIIEVNGWRVVNLSQMRLALTFTDDPMTRVTFIRRTPGNSLDPGERKSAEGPLARISYELIR